MFDLLPTGSDERGVLEVWSMPVTSLPSCQDVKNIALLPSGSEPHEVLLFGSI